MPEELDDQTQSYDAQQLVEEISEGEEKAPQVDVDADYEAAKSFSVSEIDATEAGAQAAEAATATEQHVSEPTATKMDAEAHNDPSDYRDMAKDVNPRL